ncbi:beta-galactosidase [Mycetocola sp.]|uniref:beta-galactosidase n=1 Tax=Mycetocola sp. TaxID=1871042 RepID=UPI003989F492
MTTFLSRANDLVQPTEFRRISDGFAFGGDYSPEQWPEKVWLEDIQLMRRAGVNSVNLGVFSWGLIEVADGEFDFGWLDRIMGLLHEGGIGVNLATPTAAPPIWLLQAHPEILPVNDNGIRAAQGGRLGWSPSSATFRRYALRVVEKLAERYGEHPALRLWHVSNELGNENAKCFSDETGRAWQRWLEATFTTIDALNEAWGTAFWGHHYTSFGQLQPPRYSRTGHNPGLLLDFERFSSDALLDHYRAEREVLRRITPRVPVTTNFMVQNHPGVGDYRAWAGEVDLVSNDHYTIGIDPERHGELAFSADRVRGMAGGDPWLLIEHSTSAVNWQARNRAKSAGELARNSLAHIARGAEGALFFQWRQSTAGSEQFHSAVVPHAGANTKVYREAEALGATLSAIAEVAGSRVETASVAMLFDYDAASALRSGRKPTVDINSLAVALELHRALTARGIAVDIIHPSDDLDGYTAVLVPTLFLMTGENAGRLTAWVSAGGHAVVTYFSGIVNEHNRVHGTYPGVLRDLLGVRVEEIFPLFEDERVTLDNGWTGSIWTELTHLDGATAVAGYATGELEGVPAITRNTVGAGSASYVATHLDAESTGALVDDLVSRANLRPVAVADRGLELTRRVGDDRSWLFAINHSPDPLHLDAAGLDLVTGNRFEAGAVAPGSVVVLREDTRS